MQFKFALLLVVLGMSVAACNQAVEDTIVDNVAEETENFSVEPNAVAHIEVTGMTCEMGCGSEIRKGLKSSGAVASTKFIDFDADNATNIAEVRFDKSSLSDADLKKIIEGLNDGQFTVGTIDIELLDNGTVNESERQTKEEPTVSMKESTWKFPNLFELLSYFVI